MSKLARWIDLYRRRRAIYKAIKYDPNARLYIDEALSPVLDDETDTHEMFRTVEAKAYVVREPKLANARAGIAA